MTTKFEQLIEYVINDEQAKARELFHDIVVEKSRQIYEEMMQEEEKDLEESEEDLEEAKDEGEDKIEEGMDDTVMGGDQTEGLMRSVEAEEEGMTMEADDEEGMGDDMDDAELEDRVVDLEDKLDELMAEFESLMGDEGGMGDEGSMGDEEEIDMDVGMDDEGDIDVDMDSEEVVDDELETEGMMEAVSLKAVPAPKHGDDGANKKSPVAANSGARGAMAKPVHVTGETAQGRTAPTAKDMIGKVGNTPSQSTQKPTAATKPTLSQASGVNTKSVIK